MKKIILILSFIFLFVLSLKGIEFLINASKVTTETREEKTETPKTENPEEESPELADPIENPESRVTKKSFGEFINPENSPIQPERFSGFHTGVDFEVFEEELNTKIPIKAICSGPIKIRRQASGYGGVVVQSCNLKSQEVTVVYGHLDLNSIEKREKDQLEKNEFIGNLGKDRSSETDGERKHLHLGIHKSSYVNILGYVQNENELKEWIDPCLYFCN